MHLYIKDGAAAGLVGQVAKRLGLSKQDAVKLSIQAALERKEDPNRLYASDFQLLEQRTRCRLRPGDRQIAIIAGEADADHYPNCIEPEEVRLARPYLLGRQ